MEQAHHNHPVNPSLKPASGGDSFLGVALSQAFMGMVYGPGLETAWEACEVADAVYTDRRTNDNGNFELGAKKGLGGIFTRVSNSQQSPAEIEHDFFRPVSQPAAAFRLQ